MSDLFNMQIMFLTEEPNLHTKIKLVSCTNTEENCTDVVVVVVDVIVVVF